MHGMITKGGASSEKHASNKSEYHGTECKIFALLQFNEYFD